MNKSLYSYYAIETIIKIYQWINAEDSLEGNNKVKFIKNLEKSNNQLDNLNIDNVELSVQNDKDQLIDGIFSIKCSFKLLTTYSNLGLDIYTILENLELFGVFF